MTGQNSAGNVAAHSAEAMHIHRLAGIDLIKMSTEIAQRDVDKTFDTASAVLIGFPDIKQSYRCRIQFAQILPVEDLYPAGDNAAIPATLIGSFAEEYGGA